MMWEKALQTKLPVTKVEALRGAPESCYQISWVTELFQEKEMP